MGSTPAALMAEMAALRKQNRLQSARLQRAGVQRRQEQIDRMVDKALLDALALVTLHVGGGEIVRDVAPLPQRRWAHAAALLRLAGLATGRTVRLTLRDTPQATLAALEAAAEAARRNPMLWARHMPDYNRPKLLRPPR